MLSNYHKTSPTVGLVRMTHPDLSLCCQVLTSYIVLLLRLISTIQQLCHSEMVYFLSRVSGIEVEGGGGGWNLFGCWVGVMLS